MTAHCVWFLKNLKSNPERFPIDSRAEDSNQMVLQKGKILVEKKEATRECRSCA
jgi:hypothetical protein